MSGHVWLLNTRPEHTSALEQSGAVYSAKRGQWWIRGETIPEQLRRLGIGYRAPGRDGAVYTGADWLMECGRVAVDELRAKLGEIDGLRARVSELEAEITRLHSELAKARAGYTEPDNTPELELDGYGAALDADLGALTGYPSRGAIIAAIDRAALTGEIDCLGLAQTLTDDQDIADGVKITIAGELEARGWERVQSGAEPVYREVDNASLDNIQSLRNLPRGTSARRKREARAALYRRNLAQYGAADRRTVQYAGVN